MNQITPSGRGEKYKQDIQEEYDRAMKIADAQLMRLSGERMQMVADMHQNQIEEEGEIIRDIITQKNQMVDSVISMMNQSFVTSQKILASGFTR
ncbi:MAG: hypothetical protein IH912_06250 [Proteobacteria bacterium]|nr:hypothetical protein [Pseudomonadota bacterium]